jgi:hypothetical protein
MNYPLQVIIKNVYGVERIYPVNETAKKITSLTRKKTLDRDEIEVIKKLGYQIEVLTDQL